MTVKYLKLLDGTDFCPLKPEIAPSSIGFRLKRLTEIFILEYQCRVKQSSDFLFVIISRLLLFEVPHNIPNLILFRVSVRSLTWTNLNPLIRKLMTFKKRWECNFSFRLPALNAVLDCQSLWSGLPKFMIF